MRKKRILLSRHAVERMLKRNISHADVQKTIDHPTFKFPLEIDDTQEFRRKVDSKEHFVVVEHRKKEIIVITTGWTQ